MIRYFLSFFLFVVVNADAQQSLYTTANAHSHNDYEKKSPFWGAYSQGFGSIEVDIFLQDGELLVAHEKSQLSRHWTLYSLYLLPLLQTINKNGGHVYEDAKKHLQLLIDIKTASDETLKALVDKMKMYPTLTDNKSLQLVITGNKPASNTWAGWPTWMYFDGDIRQQYTNDELKRVALFSDNFAKSSGWNGKGRLPEKELQTINQLIATAHGKNKKIRFWNAPDFINSWYAYMDLGIDYINTDQIEAMGNFLKQFPDRHYSPATVHETYTPTRKNDGLDKPVKNIILLIGDGTGLAQWFAGYTVNNRKLNVFNMRYTGLSKTSSYDNYITDSAPGATAFSSGVKTNNRAVGVDNTGAKLLLFPEIIRQRKMKTGIITSGDLRDATPASFYAHQSERSKYPEILKDLAEVPVDIIMGACDLKNQDEIVTSLKKQFTIISTIDSVSKVSASRIMVADPKAALHMLDGRGDWASTAFTNAIQFLNRSKDGFFLMLEGAQIDHGGHANKLPFAISELLDFDQVIGKAMEFADRDGETLVIVAADHETGGLTLTGGDYEKRMINGQFSTGDHTAIPIPVFAYGPQAQLFTGVYENTEIFYKMLQALKIRR